MSENTAPERIELVGLIEQMESAHEYQRHLEAENWRLTADLAEVRADYGDLVENRDAFARRVQELERERDGLNRDQTELAARVDELKALLADQATAPRVITADELKAGQKLAIESVGGVGDVFTVQSVGTSWEGYPAAYKTGGSFWAITEDERIWLLEDAPAEEPVKVGDTVRTVAELDGLAHGSVVLDYFDDAHQKAVGVWWEAARREERDAAGMLTYGPFTVLYLPEEDA